MIGHRRQKRRHQPSTASVLVKGLGAIAVAVAVFLLGLTAVNGVPGIPHYNLRAQFDELTNLAPNAEVRIGGSRVGQVLSPRFEDGRATLELQLDADIEPLPADSTLLIRERSLLGKRYVEIEPGSSKRMLADGATIAASQTSASVQLPEILDSLDRRSRSGFGTTLSELGKGFLGRGAGLNSALGDTPAFLRHQTQLADTINDRDGAASRFFPSIESAFAAVDPVRTEIAQGFDPQAQALNPLSDSRSAVQDLLEESPEALPEIRGALANSDPLIAEATLFLRATERMTRPAPAAFAEAAALLAESRDPLRRSRPLLRHTAAAVPPLLRFARRVDPEIGDLRSSLQDSRPPLGQLAQRGCDLSGWASNWRSMMGYGSPGAEGPLGPYNVIRLGGLLAGPEGIRGSSEPIEHSSASDPYPEPCLAGTKELP